MLWILHIIVIASVKMRGAEVVDNSDNALVALRLSPKKLDSKRLDKITR